MKENLLICVSGGRASAIMARHIQTSPKYKDYNKLYVFCNTGQERPETIQFLKDIVKYWDIPLVLIEGVYSLEKGVGVKHRVVDFDNLCMKSEPFKECIKHLNKNKWIGVPNQATPYCSEYLKTRPAHSLAKDIFGSTKYIKAIGYRFEDIPKRITPAELREDKKRIAPLLTDFETPRNKYHLTYFFRKELFQLSIPSNLGNCKLCYKKGDDNLVLALNTDMDEYTIKWYEEQEEEYNNTFFRGQRGIKELVEIAKSTKPQIDLFNQDVDADGCVCNF
jgi:hypothetical protein